MTPSDLIGDGSASLEARLLDIVQQAVIATDLDGTVTFWNAYAQHMFGWSAEEAIGRSILDVTPSSSSREDAVAIMDRLSRGASWSGEFDVQRKDGTEFTAFVVNSPILDEDGRLIGIVGVSTDVSERRALELQVHEAAKMEAIGRLAGGIAHDFNNLLTVILGHADMALADRATDPASRVAMEAISAAASRAAELTQQLLAFSRRQRVAPRVVDVGDALHTLLPMLRRLIEAPIDVRLDVPDAPLLTVIDPSQLDQVVVNLAVNARDAMPDGGRLDLRVEPVTAADAHAPADPDGAWLRLRVTDTGVGMSAEMIPHVFEPFFTTKEPGIGTGIGLATVFGIVEQAGGAIRVESEPGVGTTFSVLLPRTTARVSGERATSPAPRAPREGRTVLVVEDEPALRALTCQILEAAGFTVLAADRPATAAALLDDHPAPIDLVLTDVVMPDGSGIELAERAVRARPGTRVVFMTGYATDDVLRGDRAAAGVPVVQKPFTAAALLAVIDTALASDG